MYKLLMLAASTVITLVAAQDAAIAQTRISGTISAASPCDILPIQETESKACMQIVLPIQGSIRITSLNGKVMTTRLNQSGTFATKLRPGTYSLQLVKVKIFGNATTVRVADLRLSTSSITIGSRPLNLKIGVIHKSYRVSNGQ
jgi:hypothetical protein